MKYSIILLIFFKSFCYPSQINMFVSQTANEDYRLGKNTSLEAGANVLVNETFRLDTNTFKNLFTVTNLRLRTAYRYSEFEDYNYLIPSENEFFAELIFKYKLGWSADPFISSSINSTPLVGFRPLRNKVQQVSNWRDPITTTQNLGFAISYRKSRNSILTRLGIAYNQIRAENYTTLTDNRKTLDVIENYKEETGIQINNDLNLMLDSNVKLRSNLLMFSTFENLEVWRLTSQNEVQFNIWKMFVAIFRLNVMYEEKQSLKVQYNQSFRVGIVGNMN